MMNTDYLIYLVKTYFSTVFFLWVVANILLRLFVTKKKKKKRKGKKGGGDVFYNIWCFLLKIFTLGEHECFTEINTDKFKKTQGRFEQALENASYTEMREAFTIGKANKNKGKWSTFI